MEIIQLILAAIILVTIYKRMLKWGSAGDLSKKQKYAPIGLGILSVIISFLFVAGIALFSVKVLGFHLGEIENQSLRAAVKAFTMAGLTEEIAKLLMIILSIKLFSPKRVYEYTLIGAAVGIGFTIHEELLYGGSIAGLLRFITVAMHMVLGIIMGQNLGIGKYNIANGLSHKAAYLKAVLIPMIIHTLFDACTIFNPVANMAEELEADDFIALVWLSIGILAIISAAIYQFVVLKKTKKEAEKQSGMLVVNLPDT
jgi:RsiW-degrading membrane proteinase PrsW (M82 family)